MENEIKNRCTIGLLINSQNRVNSDSIFVSFLKNHQTWIPSLSDLQNQSIPIPISINSVTPWRCKPEHGQNSNLFKNCFWKSWISSSHEFKTYFHRIRKHPALDVEKRDFLWRHNVANLEGKKFDLQYSQFDSGACCVFQNFCSSPNYQRLNFITAKCIHKVRTRRIYSIAILATQFQIETVRMIRLISSETGFIFFLLW